MRDELPYQILDHDLYNRVPSDTFAGHTRDEQVKESHFFNHERTTNSYKLKMGKTMKNVTTIIVQNKEEKTFRIKSACSHPIRVE